MEATHKKGHQLPQSCPGEKKKKDGKVSEIHVLWCTHQRMEIKPDSETENWRLYLSWIFIIRYSKRKKATLQGHNLDYRMKVRGEFEVIRKLFKIRTFTKWNEHSGVGTDKVLVLMGGGCIDVCFTVTVDAHYSWISNMPIHLPKCL